ncbi:hypothetical protein HRbin11_01915 [bacterium HR11]|nr:hypothetical protein HRbin11_01915 [bacterium HR11]
MGRLPDARYFRKAAGWATAILLIAGFWAPVRAADDWNGFDVSFSLVPRDQILRGGPPKDGIPALTYPPVRPADRAGDLKADDWVVGVRIGAEARAYPLRILVWHEAVNDTLGGVPILVTYCPLCNSALVFERHVGGQVREFGVSGLLYNSNLLLYDRQPTPSQESLWSQVMMRAVTGPAARAGWKLTLVPAEMLPWGDWKRRYPQTTVLSFQTGHGRNYYQDPYRRYHLFRDQVLFPVWLRRPKPKGVSLKDMVVVVQADSALRAYRFEDVKRQTQRTGSLEDRLGSVRVRLTYIEKGRWVRVESPDEPDRPLPVAYMYWFALASMLPDVEVYAPGSP